MGVWSTSISDSDDFQDVKDIFFDYFYHDKISIEEIENKIIEIYSEQILNRSSGEWHDVYFAIAYCEWKCGSVSERILSRVEDIIVGGKSLEYWRELNATPKTLTQRKRALLNFLDKIKSTNDRPIKRRYKKPFVFPMKTGDVFACYSKANGYYGCGVALEVRDSQFKFWEEAYHFRALFAISDYTPNELPTVEQVLNSNALDVFWNGGCHYNLPKRGIIVVGNVAEQIDRDFSEYFGSFKIDGHVYCVHSLRANFDDLISHDESKLCKDGFSVLNKPMTFFFHKSNLSTTNEILKME
ncbi:MAG: hypothetical protein NC184_04660 [Roseburia sp.]|nr:hypothetical protein [Roseburia sp.]